MTSGSGSWFDPLTLDSDDDDHGALKTKAEDDWIALDDDCSILPFSVKKEQVQLDLSLGLPSWSDFKRPKLEPCATAENPLFNKPSAKVEVTKEAKGVKEEVNVAVKEEVNVAVKEEVKVAVKEEVKVAVKEEVKVAVKEEVKVAVKKEVKVEDTKLTREQQQVLDLVREGKNVFFTGSGGTGKSFLLHQIYKMLEYKIEEVAFTAPTGIAAIAIGGSTLHRVAGFGIPRCRQDFLEMVKKIYVAEKWRSLSVLIIDEISMVSAEFLEYFEQMLRFIRSEDEKKNREHIQPGKPFGGLQVIFAGDFFQLQPIPEKQTFTSKDQFLNKGLAFEAPAWHKANLNTVILKHVFRQEDDSFVSMLDGIRTGENPAALQEIMRKCSRPLPERHGIVPTVVFSTNKAVDRHNNEKLYELPFDQVVLDATEEISTNEELKIEEKQMRYIIDVQYRRLTEAEFWKECPAPRQIKLKIGAQVMLLKNLQLEGNKKDLVNGSRGIVVGWKPRQELWEECQEIQRYEESLRGRSSHEQVSLAEMKANRILKNLKGTKQQFIPVVEFLNGCIVNCVPEKFDYRMLNVGECRRRQVPLKLAWALTIHKCQGMTLDYVKVTLKEIFAEGQVYVALSRARSMEGLQVVGTGSQRDVRVSKKVIRFYKALAANEVPSFRTSLVFPDLNFDELLKGDASQCPEDFFCRDRK